MRWLAILPLLLAGAAAPVDHPATYLLSVVDLPLGKDDAVEQFSFATWGVDVDAVCHIPGGWHITAGRASNPEGRIAGVGSNGVTWLRERNPAILRDLVLVTMYAPVQRDRQGAVPATFAGTASIVGPDTDRTATLSWRNVRLVPSGRCPPRRYRSG